MQPHAESLAIAAQSATHFLESLTDRSVSPSDLGTLTQLAGPLPEGPTGPTQVIQLLDQAGSPAAVAAAGGRYFGFVNGSALPASLAATWLAAAWNQNAGLRVTSPVAATLEDVSLEWARQLLGCRRLRCARKRCDRSRDCGRARSDHCSTEFHFSNSELRCLAARLNHVLELST